MLLIIQEELEATLTGFHIQLETRLRGKSAPGGGAAVSRGTRQRKTLETRSPLQTEPVQLSNGTCDTMLSFIAHNQCVAAYD